jgi:hypothetical protein
MPPKKSSVPIVGDILRTTSKGVSGAILTIQTTSKKIPVVGTAVHLVQNTVSAATKTVGKVPGVRNVATGLKRGTSKVADSIPMVSNVKRGMTNASRANKKKMKMNNQP